MIKDYKFTVPQEIIFGMDSLNKLPEIMDNDGLKKAMIISDKMLDDIGVVGKVMDIMDDSGYTCETFLDVEPNPTVDMVNKATLQFNESEFDCIVALGGGSPMDVAKAVGVLAAYKGEITEYEGPEKVPGDIIPIIAIPTTAGTGSETTPFSVITDESRNYKLSVYSYKIIPKYAILDPRLIMTLPPSVAASTGIDAYIHALESYLSKGASPFSDSMAEKALELISNNIKLFVADRTNEKAASAMMSASMFGGLAFGWARLGNVHAMAHPLSAYYNVPHGVANAILLPYVLEYNILADNGRYEKIYRYLNPNDNNCFEPIMLVEEIKKLNDSLGIPKTLTEVGVTDEYISNMAEDAMKSGNIFANPRQSTKKDIEMLYNKAL